jgi:magnesium transporter
VHNEICATFAASFISLWLGIFHVKKAIAMEQVLIEKDKILAFIENSDWMGLRHELEEWDPIDIANLVADLDPPEDVIVFRLLPNEVATDMFQLLDRGKQEELVNSLSERQYRLAQLVNDMDPDDRTALLEEMPGSVSQYLIQLLNPEERKVAMDLLGYPEDSIGRLMTPNYVAVRPHFTIEQTLEHIRRFGEDSETLNMVYVVDGKWKLIDDLRLREILLAPASEKISSLMDDRFVALEATEDQETAIRHFQDHDRVALPVTDRKGTLLGIVTFDDVMDVAEEEATEDFHKFGSIQDIVSNPLKAKITYLYQKRIFWLFTLVFMNVFSGAALAYYENTILMVSSLIFFLPLLIASGGNAGAQSATLMVRALATGEVEIKDWFRLMGKELLVSLLLGVTMALGAVLVASVRAPEIIMVIAVSMTSIVLVGSLVGLSLPFIFTKLGFDPATASAPLVTSIADISGVVIYFATANWLLGL